MERSAGWHARERAAERIAGFVRRGLDLVTFWEEARATLEKAVPHHLTPCWFTMDPSSLLITSHYDHGVITELPHDWLAQEYLDDDYNSLRDVARSARGAATLHEATGGDPSRSARWENFIQPYGGEQELLVALRTRSGEAWGILALYREAGQPLFSEDEIGFLQKLAPALAAGAQRALLVGEAVEQDVEEAPGLVILNEDMTVESATAAGERWLAELSHRLSNTVALPASILSVAGTALRTLSWSDLPAGDAFARVRTDDGRWVALHGSPLAGTERRVAIIIEPAHPARLVPLLMDAYRLTDRERDITQLVLQGASTDEIAKALAISGQTVQQHLKGVFKKAQVRSRRELVGRVFFSHYEPRLRDNERRAMDQRPLRGGPMEPTSD